MFIRADWYARDRTAGDWRSGKGTGLFGRTIGIIGASRTGRLVLDRLRAHDVRLLLSDPYVTADGARALGAELVDVDELCRRSEVVSVHAPALPETHHLLDVTDPEPLPPGHPLLTLPNVLVTPHLAGSQGHELRRLGGFTVAEVARFTRGEPLQGAICSSDLHRIA